MTPISSACWLDAREGIDEEAEAILTKVATVHHEKILVLNQDRPGCRAKSCWR